MKHRKLLILFISLLFIFCVGITYSMFQSDASLSVEDRNFAKFVFNAESLDRLELSLIDVNPGDTKEYLFGVTNNAESKVSEVTVVYQFIIKTYHFIPFVIELYKVDGENEVLVYECSEDKTRNSENELVCNSPEQTMPYISESFDNYKLKLEFPSEYNDVSYSGLVDYINVEIKSWQK